MSKRVNATEAKKLQDEGFTYVDVRTEAEFGNGHPERYINIPFNAPNFVDLVKAKFAPDAKLIIGCQMGGRSMRATAALAQAGFTHLADNGGGYEEWSQKKLPTSKGA